MQTPPVDVVTAWPWPDHTTFTPSADGLINTTFIAHAGGEIVGVLQRLNTDIFSPVVHEDIAAITEHLAAKAVPTPRLRPTGQHTLWHEAPSGTWRVLTPIGDRTCHTLSGPAEAQEAGALVGRFHAAVSDLDWAFRSVRAGAHDTPAHMAALTRALQGHPKHRLAEPVKRVADGLFRQYRTLPAETELPHRVVHGDLKVSNLRWQGPRALALIDLDTLAHGTLDVELGDALRSWCNTGGEDTENPRFDLDLFGAAMRGWAQHGDATEAEWHSVLPGVERLCLELAARFARDALVESYFGWDATSFPAAGEHNLLRAQGQAALAKSVHAQRHQAEALPVSTRATRSSES